MNVLQVFREAAQWNKDGEVVLRSGKETGRVFFSAGKIAWATVSSVKRTFTRYLIDHSPLGEEEVKEVFQDCQRTGRKLAETVVEWGLLNEPTVRRLLLEHISECVLGIFTWPEVEAMFMPEDRSYERTLTFELAEVLETAYKFDTDGKLPFGHTPVDQVLAELKQGGKGMLQLGEGDPAFAPRRSKGKVIAFALVTVLLAAAGAGAWLFRHELLDSFTDRRPDDPPPPKSMEPVVDRTGDGDRPAAGEATPGQARPVAAAVDGGEPDASRSADAKPAAVTSSGDEPTEAGASQSPAEGERKPTAVAAASEPGGCGDVRVVSKPSKAKVYLNGVFVGKRTPTTLAKLPAGREQWILLEKRGLRPTYRKLTVDDGQKMTVRLRLSRRGKRRRGAARVRVRSEPPGALIVLNGRSTRRRTPSELKLSVEKPTKLELRRKGHSRWIRMVRPVPGQKLTIVGTLKPK